MGAGHGAVAGEDATIATGAIMQGRRLQLLPHWPLQHHARRMQLDGLPPIPGQQVHAIIDAKLLVVCALWQTDTFFEDAITFESIWVTDLDSIRSVPFQNGVFILLWRAPALRVKEPRPNEAKSQYCQCDYK